MLYADLRICQMFAMVNEHITQTISYCTHDICSNASTICVHPYFSVELIFKILEEKKYDMN